MSELSVPMLLFKLTASLFVVLMLLALVEDSIPDKYKDMVGLPIVALFLVFGVSWILSVIWMVF